MPTRNVNLSAKQANFIRRSVNRGQFRNASEVVRAGLQLLEQEEQENRLKLKVLRQMVKDGFDAIDRGEYETITAENLDAFMDSVVRAKIKVGYDQLQRGETVDPSEVLAEFRSLGKASRTRSKRLRGTGDANRLKRNNDGKVSRT